MGFIFNLLLFPTHALSMTDFNQLIHSINKKNNIKTISISEFSKNQKKYTILDTRELNEYEVSHISGAHHVGYKKFDINKTIKNIIKARPIVVYCSLGVRSGKVAKKLLAKGYKVLNLSGGVFAWHNQGYKLVNTQGKVTKTVHGYNKNWSKWVLGNTVY